MPWANTDPNAVARVNNKWLNVEATERGKETIRAITGKEVASDLIVPASGYSETKTELPFLVADNTGWEGEAATFNANQAALLAHPQAARPRALPAPHPAAGQLVSLTLFLL